LVIEWFVRRAVLATTEPKPHSVTVPDHSPLKVGTLAAILADIASHRGMSREALLMVLFAN
jgi:hypothetical protein